MFFQKRPPATQHKDDNELDVKRIQQHSPNDYALMNGTDCTSSSTIPNTKNKRKVHDSFNISNESIKDVSMYDEKNISNRNIVEYSENYPSAMNLGTPTHNMKSDPSPLKFVEDHRKVPEIQPHKYSGNLQSLRKSATYFDADDKTCSRYSVNETTSKPITCSVKDLCAGLCKQL